VFEQKFDRVLLPCPAAQTRGVHASLSDSISTPLLSKSFISYMCPAIRNQRTHFSSDVTSTSTYRIIDQHHKSTTDSAQGISVTYLSSMMQRSGSHTRREGRIGPMVEQVPCRATWENIVLPENSLEFHRNITDQKNKKIKQGSNTAPAIQQRGTIGSHLYS
jgi:hypothetical protein